MHHDEELAFQAEAIVLRRIREDRKAAAGVEAHLRAFPGSIRLLCYVCGEKLSDTFRFHSDAMSVHRGEGECDKCGIPYTMFHFAPIGAELYLKIEYFFNSWNQEKLQNMRQLWELSDSRQDFWRNVLLAYPVQDSEQ